MDKKMIGDKEDNVNQILKHVAKHVEINSEKSPATKLMIAINGESTLTLIERLRKNLIKLLKVAENVTPTKKDELPF